MTSDLSDPSAPNAAAHDPSLDDGHFGGIRVPRLGEDATGWTLDANDESSDDRTVITPGGKRIATWREGYPYTALMTRKEYEGSKRSLQIELLKLQSWVKESGQKVVLLFEGRDAAGKGGVIKRITQRLNPRVCRVAALPAPSDRERTQWYFQRYVSHLPAAGEIVLFDRS
ncbi:MAG: uncharacterized protein JWN20_134, partial [Jatrophihabitantaceae bacterium]|nr:uncharacterized protein [Jatrophihabitantaceae bacterium]